MSSVEQVKEWHAEGKFQEEFLILQAILEKRKFTQQQIASCFQTILSVSGFMVEHRKGKATIELVKEYIRHSLSDEIDVVESCLEQIAFSNVPKSEQLETLSMVTENALWEMKAGESPDVQDS